MAGSKTRSRKEKASTKNAKGQRKASVKASGSSDTVSCSPASAYNPISGTFHSLEIPLGASSPPFHDNGPFKNTDDTDEHSSSPNGTEFEYDSVSNNGSSSGESQDSKDKLANSNRPESVPGLDNEKREKIRLKNEKKHQRQKEKRAKELHERCIGFLMARKLEALSQQLVAMGFSYERATLALVLNEGKLEASVNWLFEGNEEEAHNKEARLGNTDHLKVDITEELAQILALELRYKCTRQEVERVIAALEGDLVKAEEMLEAQKRESLATVFTPDEFKDASSLKIMQKKSMLQPQQKRNEQDPNFAKTGATVPMFSEPGSRNFQSGHQAKAMSPAFSSSMTSMPVRLGVSGNEAMNHKQLVREPVVMMQRPQSINVKQNQVPSIGALPSISAGWHSSNVPGAEKLMSNGNFFQNQSATRPDQYYQPVSYKDSSFPFNGPVDPAFAVGLGGSWRGTMGKSPSKKAPSLVTPSSLGLFTGYSSSPRVDWNTGGGLMQEFDYTRIDWTLDPSLLASKANGWQTSSPYMPGFQDKEMSVGPGLSEWTSPFARKDMFSLPSLFVTSPAP